MYASWVALRYAISTRCASAMRRALPAVYAIGRLSIAAVGAKNTIVQPPPSVIMSQVTEIGASPPKPSGSIMYVPLGRAGLAVWIAKQLAGAGKASASDEVSASDA